MDTVSAHLRLLRLVKNCGGADFLTLVFAQGIINDLVHLQRLPELPKSSVDYLTNLRGSIYS